MTSTNDIRRSFLDYFAGTGHHIEPSAPLVPYNDPTLMFVNAGMVPFKNVFTGLETRPYSTAASSQKCVRAGGKHNDLDNVGFTARHHTFFEMLGNFSFGDYFKEQAIHHAWTLVTKTWGLAPEKLTVTVYHTDDEAFALWKKIAGLPEERIIRIATSDNFWSMGDTGPCGPCSEIFYDHGDHIWGGPPGSPDEDGDRFVEIWNLVFMQYDQRGPGDRIDLPRPSIDTGMGLERVAAVLQGVHDNYDTDTFKALIAASVDLTGVPAEGTTQASHRVIADHLRASSFLIADGVLPSAEGRGYVLRRIMRRAMRHAHLLGAKDPLMYRLLPSLTAEMGAAYPELIRAQPLIAETLEREETKFRQTLDKGLRLLDEATVGMSAGATLPGDVAFKLYDTYGFPYDLTEDALRTQDIAVDRAGFDAAMAQQKAAARAAWKGSGQKASEEIWFDIAEAQGGTEFIGYGATEGEATVIALVKDGASVDEANVEADVNAQIRDNEAVTTRLMTPDDAVAAGALALFGEKYGDEVRVLSMGKATENHYSVELCGGTHVNALGDIALLKIISESAVSSGVRRIEALTGEAARLWLNARDEALKAAAAALKTSPDDVPARVVQLTEALKKAERELADAKKALALGGTGGGGADAAAGPAVEKVGDTAFIAQIVEGLDPKDLRGTVDGLKTKVGSGVAMLVAVNDGRASVAVGVTDDKTGSLSAVDLVKAAVAALGGQGGGGRPDMAQGGGPDGAAANDAVAAVKAALA
ncbi:MAG: alanine--tRNA ligase [Sphingomonadales bacterium]|nr:MAG: alanine--tRNA ligase [Sphingomonadales bacterium]